LASRCSSSFWHSVVSTRLYLAPQACAPGTPYADPRTVTRQRLTFWMVALPLLSLLAVPWLAPLFY
jgi:mercuric ion transport protein